MTDEQLAAIEKMSGMMVLRSGSGPELDAIQALVNEVRKLRAEHDLGRIIVDYLKANPSYPGPCPMCKRGNERPFL
jgi:hypothetical protein